MSALSVFFLFLLIAHVIHDAIQHRHENRADVEHESCLGDFLFLLLLGTGLLSRGLRGLWAGATLVYVVNLLLMSGLGRFHGLRYAALEPITQPIAGFRLAAGFDLTLLLALLNLGLFAWMLRSLGAENEALRLRDNEATGGLA